MVKEEKEEEVVNNKVVEVVEKEGKGEESQYIEELD